MPAEGVPSKGHTDILSYENMVRILRQCAQLGISRIRLTGGEPLVRKGIIGFIEQLNAIEGIEEINLTTNGILLKQYAKDLKKAGIKNINISLDTLDEKKFAGLTRGGDLKAVLEGLNAVYNEGFNKIKINVVAMRGFNMDELPAFLQLIKDKAIYLRFIELMPIGEAAQEKEKYISAEEIKKLLPPLKEAQGEKGTGPASYYTLEGYKGYLGFINPVSNCFCSECNRLRLTADGKMMPCLHSGKEVDLKPYLNPPDDEGIKQAVLHTAAIKPQRHSMESQTKSEETNRRYMVQVGG
jgi:cyclic pyranopterin phosphate synthase